MDWRLALVVLSLGLDTFAVSVGLGLAGSMSRRRRLVVALTFASAEAVMPLAGVAAGLVLGRALGGWADLIAGAALALLGLHVLREREEDEPEAEGPAPDQRGPHGTERARPVGAAARAGGREGSRVPEGAAGAGSDAARRAGEMRQPAAVAGNLWLAALSVSADEAAAGLSLGALGLPVGLTSALIGMQAFGLTLLGLAIGRAVGRRAREGAERLGGLVLLLLGLYILVRRALTLLA